jgi:hypothetical protein
MMHPIEAVLVGLFTFIATALIAFVWIYRVTDQRDKARARVDSLNQELALVREELGLAIEDLNDLRKVAGSKTHGGLIGYVSRMRLLFMQTIGALEIAHNGLLWYQDKFKQVTDGSDDEANVAIETALDAAITFLGGKDTTKPATEELLEIFMRQRDVWSITDAIKIQTFIESASRDSRLLDWLEQHDGRHYNIDRIASFVGKGFIVGPIHKDKQRTFHGLREAIEYMQSLQRDSMVSQQQGQQGQQG